MIEDPTRGTSEPGRLWTRANVVEAAPLTLSPFCWTWWSRGLNLGGREAWARLGVLPKKAVYLPTDQNELLTGVFYGQFAMNLDVFREQFGAIPGLDADQFVVDAFGVDPGERPKPPRRPSRLAAALVKAPVTLVRHSRRLDEVHREQHAWWEAKVLGDDGVGGRRLLTEAEHRFRAAMHAQIYARSLHSPAGAQLVALGTKLGRPDLALTAAGGAGGVVENELASDLWLVSRFELSLDEFIRRHGFHGPAEGNPIGHSWREKPELVSSVAKQLNLRDEDEDPRTRMLRAQEAASAAREELLDLCPRGSRTKVRVLLRMNRWATRQLEMSKTNFLLALDGARKAVRQIDAELLADGRIEQPDDAFMFTYDELMGELPANAAQVAATRRATREHYSTLVLPLTFEGPPVPEEATGEASDDAAVGGLGASAGVVAGRARIALTPDVDDLEPGDILICPTTDPSWAALFTLVDGLVIDIGTSASHGAIIARELGLPCVIGTSNGTRRIREGDRIQIDGSTGTVLVLERNREACEG